MSKSSMLQAVAGGSKSGTAVRSKLAEPVTLRDVARHAKVSVGTVSRALMGQTGVGVKKAQRIVDLAQEMGYRPQPLRRKLTGSIGVFVATDEPGQPDEDWSQRLIVLATQAARDMGLHVHLEFIARRHGQQLPSVVKENRVDGVLLAAHPHSLLLKQLKAYGTPMVMIGGRAQEAGCVCVNPDRQQAVNEAITRLVDAGHRRFGVVLSDRRYPSTEQFYQACRKRLEECGLELSEQQVQQVIAPNMAGGAMAVQRWLNSDEPMPTAMLMTNDWMAMGALQVLTQAGRRVPEDVSIIGQDNRNWCNHSTPTLSSIDHHEPQMVRLAMEHLKKQIDGQEVQPQDVYVRSDLVWRASCGAAG